MIRKHRLPSHGSSIGLRFSSTITTALCLFICSEIADAVQQVPEKNVAVGQDTVKRPSSRTTPPAAEPLDSGDTLRVPSVEDTPAPTPENPAVQARIREALSDPSRITESGDPILDGILKEVGRRGNVFQQTPDESQMPSIFDHALPSFDPLHRQEQEDQLYFAAEHLLSTARLLSRLPGPSDNDRRRLVSAMRRQAAKLLDLAESLREENPPSAAFGDRGSSGFPPGPQ